MVDSARIEEVNMHTTISNSGEHIVISFEGSLDFEQADNVLQNLKKQVSSDSLEKYLIDMRSLDFVGSSGIEKFMRALQNLFGDTPKCIGVKNEFKRCFSVFSHGQHPFKYYTTLDNAILDFDAENDDITTIDTEILDC
jgi:anti-anti-sigma factor